LGATTYVAVSGDRQHNSGEEKCKRESLCSFSIRNLRDWAERVTSPLRSISSGITGDLFCNIDLFSNQ